MRPKEEEAKVAREATGAFILSEKIDDSKSRKSEKEMKKELRRLAREKIEQEKKERKAKEKMAQLQQKQAKKGKVVCGGCGGKCAGEVLRVGARYFHAACFVCRTCSASLATGGFFAKDGHYYCPQDYQRAFGTRCAACRQYVEGEVVSALGNTYHQRCFTCARCSRAFPSGEKVTYTGSEVVCSACMAAPERHTAHTARTAGAPQTRSPARQAHSPAQQIHSPVQQTRSPQSEVPPTQRNGTDTNGKDVDPNECAGCGQQLWEGQALVALARQWHPACFACAACGRALHGEYMGQGGAPYCERDYQRLFGVRCAYCQRYIAGKVLQAGEQHHFHPTCARCSKCGDPFGDGEEMFLQGAAIWHPRCGPAPGDTLPRAASELMWSRSRTPSVNGSYGSPYSSLNRKWGGVSPGLTLRSGRSPCPSPPPPHRITAYSYLAGEPPSYLRRPLPPPDQPRSPHFHRPSSANSTRPSSRAGSKTPRPAMAALVHSLRADTPRAHSPTPLNNEEPIELSVYPAAHKPLPGEPAKIDRDDFPAPPYPYTDPERRRRWSDSYKGVPDSDEEPAANGDGVDARLKKEEQELAKIDTGIAQVFLKEVKEREKLQQWKKQNLDPRNASRTPSAAREPGPRLRFPSPLGASPSRHLPDPAHCSPHYHYHSLSANDHHTHAHAHGHSPAPHYNGVSGRAATLPAGLAAGRPPPAAAATLRAARMGRAPSAEPTYGELTFSGLEHTHSTDFSSNKSDVSAGSITDVDRSAMTTGGLAPRPGPPGAMRGVSSVRRSLPNMAAGHLLHQPAKLYPYHLLLSSNYRLPPDADRLHLERHLSDQEFEAILQLPRADFYRLPQWRQNELKRRARLF